MENNLTLCGREQHGSIMIYKYFKDRNDLIVSDVATLADSSGTIIEFKIRCHDPKYKLLRGWGLKDHKSNALTATFSKKLKPLSQVDADLVDLWKKLFYERNDILRSTNQTYKISSWEQFCERNFDIDINK